MTTTQGGGGAIDNKKAGMQGAPAYFLSITNRTMACSEEGHAPPHCVLPISTWQEGVHPLAVVFFILTQQGGGLLPSFLHTQPFHLGFSLSSALSFARLSTYALDFAKPGLASLASACTHDPSTLILPNWACRCLVLQKWAWLPLFASTTPLHSRFSQIEHLLDLAKLSLAACSPCLCHHPFTLGLARSSMQVLNLAKLSLAAPISASPWFCQVKHARAQFGKAKPLPALHCYLF